ncbi:MAG: hypothetical protein Q8K85_03710, partial [Hyphomicrobium sp.]|nr:hypothetical protein [Hyphomicrobium sp.]
PATRSASNEKRVLGRIATAQMQAMSPLRDVLVPEALVGESLGPGSIMIAPADNIRTAAPAGAADRMFC